MLGVQRKKVQELVALLEAWNVQYKIILPDGEQLGNLKVVREKERKRKPCLYPYGEVKTYYEPFIKDMPVGGVAEVPFGKYDPEALRGGISSYANRVWGAETTTTALNRDKQCVEVLRFK